MERLYLGVDVGTASARAALFDGAGGRRGVGAHPIRIRGGRLDLNQRPEKGHHLAGLPP